MPHVPEGFDALAIPTAMAKCPRCGSGGVSSPGCPIPNAYFAFLACGPNDQLRLSMNLTTYGDRPGYTLVSATTVDGTKELARNLGFSDTMVDVLKNRIQHGDLVLAWLPLEEHVKRDEEDARRARQATMSYDESYFAQVDQIGKRGLKPVRMQVGELSERVEHASREGRPFVSLTTTPAG